MIEAYLTTIYHRLGHSHLLHVAYCCGLIRQDVTQSVLQAITLVLKSGALQAYLEEAKIIH